VKELKVIPPNGPDSVVRGEFVGYRQERGVAPESTVETFAAMRLNINSWRWHGVPFYLRAGKELPVTCTEVFIQFRKPPAVYPEVTPPNYLRFRISPNIAIAWGLMVKVPGEELAGAETELLASHQPGKQEMDAYERLLGDAMKGDSTLFAREDYVDEAWRIVEPLLKAHGQVQEYAPQTWGPRRVDQIVSPPGGWQNPLV
jgi:glucose-6-phosphate 1-dehydrogenase